MPALTAQDIIGELFRLGHFRNPSTPTGITEADLPRLTLADAEVVTAVKSYQDFNRVALTQIYAREKGHVNVAIDGEVGPLTAQLLGLDRCACPDFQPLEEVAEATGNGSWVHSCDVKRPGVHVIRVFVDKDGLARQNSPRTVPMPAFLEPVFESKVWPLVVAAYRDIGVDFVRVNTYQECQIDLGWKIPQQYAGGGTIGLAELPGSPQSCANRRWGRFNELYQPGDLINMQARLIAHELGHIMRLQHTTGGIMNPSILSGPFTMQAWRGDPSFGILVRYFGGESIVDQPDEPNLPVPPVIKPFDYTRAVMAYDGQLFELKPKVMT